MADPEDLIRSLPPASPPPEMVKIALRMFRYRAMAVAALIVALTAAGLLASAKLQGPRTLREEFLAAKEAGSTQVIAQEQTVAGVRVLLWEVVDAGGVDWVHAFAWGPGGTSFEIDVSMISVGPYSPSIRQAGGSSFGGSGAPTGAEYWASVANRVPPAGSLPASVEVQVLAPGSPSAQIPPQIRGSATFQFTLYGGVG